MASVTVDGANREGIFRGEMKKLRIIRLMAAAFVVLGSLVAIGPPAHASDHNAAFYGSVFSVRVSGQGIWESRQLLDKLDERICDQRADSAVARAQFTYAIQDINTHALTILHAPEIMTVGPGPACKDFLGRFIAYRDSQHAYLYGVNLRLGVAAFGKSVGATTWTGTTGWRYNPYVVCTTCKDFQPLSEDPELS